MLTTERLILREMNHNDFDALYRVLADSDIMRHYPHTFDEKRGRFWIDRNLERYRVLGFGLWAVTLSDTGEMIGDCGLTMRNVNGFIRHEIGYHIARVHQKNGYASEAARGSRLRVQGDAVQEYLLLHEEGQPCLLRDGKVDRNELRG